MKFIHLLRCTASSPTRRVAALLLACLSAVSCGKPEIEPPCWETMPLIERNGFKVRQTMNGKYIKMDKVSDYYCARKSSEAKSTDYINLIYLRFYWSNGRLINVRDSQSRDVDKEKSPRIELVTNFLANPPPRTPEPQWWYQPAIPHQRYPIDLLPNYGLDQPDPDAGVGPILTKPTVYWAVRGTRDSTRGTPNVTFCSMRRPRDSDPQDHSDKATRARDPSWLIQAETYSTDLIGNTCRGGVRSANGKSGAMIDVPGAGLPDIDKIYQAASRELADIIME